MIYRHILILPFLFCMIFTALADAPMPMPLREMLDKSSLIAVACVDEITYEAGKKGQTEVFAHLDILEIWKGQKISTVKVKLLYYYAICPSPPSYPVGEDVLVFLNKTGPRKGNMYLTTGIAGGSKQLNSEELAIYKNRIDELIAINQTKGFALRISKTVDWLIACTKHPITKGEGVLELHAKSEFMQEYYVAYKGKYTPTYELTATQKRAIRAIFKNHSHHTSL